MTLEEKASKLIDFVRHPNWTKEQVASYYRMLMVEWMEKDCESQIFAHVNEVIINRWGKDGLRQIKKIAWGETETTED